MHLREDTRLPSLIVQRSCIHRIGLVPRPASVAIERDRAPKWTTSDLPGSSPFRSEAHWSGTGLAKGMRPAVMRIDRRITTGVRLLGHRVPRRNGTLHRAAGSKNPASPVPLHRLRHLILRTALAYLAPTHQPANRLALCPECGQSLFTFVLQSARCIPLFVCSTIDHGRVELHLSSEVLEIAPESRPISAIFMLRQSFRVDTVSDLSTRTFRER